MNDPASNTPSARISVALCTYNGSRFLREQLDSIARQTFLPSEIVVCDDRSTDDTLATLEQFRSTAPFPVRIVQNAERLGSTRNFEQAIRLATGEFIALCDQDDRWLPAKLQRMHDALKADPFLGGVFSDAYLIDQDSHRIGTCLFEKHKFGSEKQRTFLSNPAGTLLKHPIVTGSTLVFRAQALRYSLPIPESWVHDGWLAWMISLHSRMALIPEPLIEYRVHAGQQLGVGNSTATETRRQHYARVAGQFEELLARLLAKGWSQQNVVIAYIQEKIAFLRRQSTLSPSLAVRILQMIKLLPQYVHHARGLGSIRSDFLLGRETL
jgi:glycosyltransferase involved in cell wall biosynthesis